MFKSLGTLSAAESSAIFRLNSLRRLKSYTEISALPALRTGAGDPRMAHSFPGKRIGEILLDTMFVPQYSS
jgi:hypothetical protein